METFRAWAKESGIATDGVAIKSTAQSGNGLYSLQATKKDTQVVYIPASLILTSTRVLELDSEFSNPVFQYFMKKYEVPLEKARELAVEQERVVLSLFLTYYKFFSSKTSFWSPYMHLLPDLKLLQCTHVLFNTSAVKGTCLESSVNAKLNRLRREQEEIKNMSQNNWLQEIELDMYVWADCGFWSRAVGVGENKGDNSMALVPFFDLANHSLAEHNIRWEIVDDGGLVLLTTKEVKEKDQELSLFYGPKPNQELLFIHGFCIENNPEPSRITLPIMCFFDYQNSEDVHKMQWLNSVGGQPIITTIRSVDTTVNADEFLSNGWTMESIAVLYLVCLTHEDGLLFTEAPEDYGLPMLFTLKKKHIGDLSELYFALRDLEILPIIQLRASILLAHALQDQIHKNSMNDSLEVPKPLETYASIYRTEELDALEVALAQVNTLQQKLSTNEEVLSYLERLK